MRTLIFQRTYPGVSCCKIGGYHLNRTILPTYIDEFMDLSACQNDGKPAGRAKKSPANTALPDGPGFDPDF